MSDQLPALATPAEVAQYVHTKIASLAQDRYRGSGPTFIESGSRLLYRRQPSWNGWTSWLTTPVWKFSLTWTELGLGPTGPAPAMALGGETRRTGQGCPV